jgi:glycosyltransferase involved in cell wall biosynthesis
MAPFLSVIIPALNEEKYISGILKDLTKQSEKDFEVIVVDGNSKDQTGEKAVAFQKECSLKLVVSKKRNLAHQRNLGVKNAAGQYVIFLDADTRVGIRFIEKLKKSAIASRYLLLLPIHVPEKATYQDKLLYKVLSFFVEASHLTDKPFSYGPSAMLQRHFFNHIGGYDENVFVYEDHEIVQRTRKMGVHAKLLQNIEVKFSMRRFKKEGRLNVLRKYLIASMQLLSNGKVNEKAFTYEMGGSAAYLLKQKKNQTLPMLVNKYFDKLKKILEE